MAGSLEAFAKYRYECCEEAIFSFFVASKKDAEEQIERALLFKDIIKGYLKAKSVI